MWAFLSEHGVTMLLILLLIAVVGMLVRFVWRHRHSCGGCAGCPHAAACHKRDKDDPA